MWYAIVALVIVIAIAFGLWNSLLMDRELSVKEE